MRLVLLGNNRVVDQMAKLIEKQVDNVKYDCFYSIEDFGKMLNARSTRYDRMIFVSSLLDGVPNKSDILFNFLDYVSQKLAEMRIVILVRDATEYNMYCRIFATPLYVNIDVSKGLSTQLALSCVECDVQELKTKYERVEDLGIKTIQYEIQKDELERQTKPEQQSVQPAGKKKKKKRNIIQRIFGLGSVEDVLEEQGISTEQDQVEQKPELSDKEIEALYENTQGIVNIVDTSNNSSANAAVPPKDRPDVHIDIQPVQQEFQGVKYEDTNIKAQRDVERNAAYQQTQSYQTTVQGYIPTSIDVNIKNNNIQSTPSPDDVGDEVVYNMQGVRATNNEVTNSSSGSISRPTTQMIESVENIDNGVDEQFNIGGDRGFIPIDDIIPSNETPTTNETSVTNEIPTTTEKVAENSTGRTIGRRTAENLDSVLFGIDTPTNLFIDETENKVETGVYSVEPEIQQQEGDIEGVTDLFDKRSQPTIDTSRVEQLDFNIDDTSTNITVDEEHKDVQTGVQTAQRPEVEDDDDDFEASFIQREFSSRPSMTGNIGTSPSFDDTDLTPATSDVQEVDEVSISPIDISTDDLFNNNDGPKVVEKIVTQIVEKPVEKVVEKEVVKEVVKEVQVPVEKEKIVFVGGNSVTGHSFKDIMSKTEPVYLVVTGDRRSGVTTTALSLANLFSSQLKVLYVDFDIDTRGSLLQLGIQNIIDEPSSVQEGLKNLRSTKILPNVVHWGTNRFASLISLYGVEISSEELARAANNLAIQQDFNLVVIDCPITKLGTLEDILPISDVIICIDGTVQGIKNTMSLLSDIGDKNIYGDYAISRKIQNIMYRSARILITSLATKGVNKQFEENRGFIDKLFNLQEEAIPWIKVPVFGCLNTIGKDIKKF